MKKDKLNNFIHIAKAAIYEAGEMALRHQGRVENIGKNTEEMENDNEYFKQVRSAKTVMDVKIQELLLEATAKVFNPSEIYLDAEEDSSSKKYFSESPTKTTLVIDPIDGTLEYIQGKNGYSICVGLIENGILITALVYFPARQEFYYIEEGVSFLKKNKIQEKLIAPKVINKKIVYVNQRVDRDIINKISQKDFQVEASGEGKASWAGALVKCMKGEYATAIFHTPQMRDVLLGGIISKIPGGYACDWSGNNILWPDGGRIPKVLFGFETISEELLMSLNSK